MQQYSVIHVLGPNRESRSHEEADACSVLIDLVIRVLCTSDSCAEIESREVKKLMHAAQ